MLTHDSGGSAHDCRVVTDDVPDELLEPAPEPVCVALVGDVVVVVVVVAPGLAVTAEVDRLALGRASAGSWPVTSCTVMNTHAVTNSAAAPPAMRRRIVRMRSALAARFASASRRRSGGMSGLCGVIGVMASACPDSVSEW
jgi:hypothetical protein